MDRCTHYQTQMLDYVYDLLDEDVVRDLALHLEHCTDCQAALSAARGQQQFPGEKFRGRLRCRRGKRTRGRFAHTVTYTTRVPQQEIAATEKTSPAGVR